jgi:hypothetical protein
MDLNYLYSRRQVSLFMAENSRCQKWRRAYRAFVDGYAARIAGPRPSDCRLMRSLATQNGQ